TISIAKSDNLHKNRYITIKDLKRQRFYLSEYYIYALLFLLLIALSGSRPRVLLFLRFSDLKLSLVNILTFPKTIFNLSLLLSLYTLLFSLLFYYKAFNALTLTSLKTFKKHYLSYIIPVDTIAIISYKDQ
ncbi:unnamed protein product, partial [Fusarium graminearum]